MSTKANAPCSLLFSTHTVLKLRAPRCAREGNDVTDVAHSGDELNGAFEAEAEAGVRHGAKAAQIEIPPVVFGLQSLLAHSLRDDIEPLFALAAADDLADFGHEHIHRPHGFSVVIDAHVERFERPRIVVKNHWQL